MPLSDGLPYTGIQARLHEELGTPEPPKPKPLPPQLAARAQSAADWVGQQTIAQQRDQAQADLNMLRASRGGFASRGPLGGARPSGPGGYSPPTPSEQTAQTRAALEAEQNAYQMRQHRQALPPDQYNELLRRIAPAERARQLYGAAQRTAAVVTRQEGVDIHDFGYDPLKPETLAPAYQRAMDEALRRQQQTGDRNIQVVGVPANTGLGEEARKVVEEPFNYAGEQINRPVQAAVGLLPEHVPTPLGNVPVQGPASVAGEFGAKSLPYIAADVAAGGTLTGLYLGMGADQAGQLSDAYAAGEIDGTQFSKGLALALGPIAAGAIAPHVLHGGPQAARDFAEWVRSPEARQSFKVPEPVDIARPPGAEFQTQLGEAPGLTRANQMQGARDLGLATSATVHGQPTAAAWAEAARLAAADPRTAIQAASQGVNPEALGALEGRPGEGVAPPAQPRVATAAGELGQARLGIEGEQGHPILKAAEEDAAAYVDTLKPNPKGRPGYMTLPNEQNALPGRAINSAEDLAATRAHVEGLVQQGAQGRYWYENASKNILGAFSGSKLASQRFIGILALLSNSATVESNTANALRILNQWAAGHEITGAGTANQVAKIKAFLDNPHANAGAVKTNAFYLALLRNIDPAAWRAMRQHLPTVDVHIGRAYGYDIGTRTINGVAKDKSIGDAQYVFPARDILRITEKLNAQLTPGDRPWTYDQVQAAMWTGQKATTQGAGLEQAALNYGDVLQRHRTNVSVESAPGTTWRRSDGGQQLEGLESAPPAVQRAYHRDMMGAVTDARGNNTLATALGVGQGTSVRGTGVFEGAFNPVTHFQVYTSTAKGGIQSGLVGAESGALLDALAASHGIVFHQDASAWSRVFPLSNKYRQNAVALTVGRALKPAELAALEDGLRQRGYEPAIVTTKEGAYILDTGQEGMAPGQPAAVKKTAGARTKDFQTVTDEVVGSVLPEGETALTDPLGYHSGYHTNDWSAQPNGEGYQGIIDSSGVAAATRGRLSAAIREASGKAEAVNRSYADRYGWKYESTRRAGRAPAAEAGRVGAAAATRVGTTATGAAIGGAIGDSPEDRMRNALIGAGLGALTGEGVLRLAGHLGGEAGALGGQGDVGDILRTRAEARTSTPEELQRLAQNQGLARTQEQLAIDRGEIAPGSAPAGEVQRVYHGTAEPLRGGNLEAGAFVTTNRADAETFARLQARLSGGEPHVYEFDAAPGALKPSETQGLAASRGAMQVADPAQLTPATGAVAERTPGANPVTAEDIMGTGEPAAAGGDLAAMRTQELAALVRRESAPGDASPPNVDLVQRGTAELTRRAQAGDTVARNLLEEPEMTGKPVAEHGVETQLLIEHIYDDANAAALGGEAAVEPRQRLQFLLSSMVQRASSGDTYAMRWLQGQPGKHYLDEFGGVQAQLAARAGGAATGAAIGAATGQSPEDRVRNALIGAGIGAAATEAVLRAPQIADALRGRELGALTPGEKPANKLGFNPTEEELAHFRDVIERGDWTDNPGARIGAKAALNMLSRGEAPSDKQLAMLYRALEQPPPPDIVKPQETAAEFTRTPETPAPQAMGGGTGGAAPPSTPFTPETPQPSPGVPPEGGVQGMLGVTPSTSHATPAEMKAGLEGAYPTQLPEKGVQLPLGTAQERAAQQVLDTAIRQILDSAQPYQRLMAFLRHMGTGAGSVLGFVKTFKTAFDLSWAGRQGWRLLPANPREWAEAFKMQFKAAGSEEGYNAINEAARAFPLFERTQQLSRNGGRDAAYLELGTGDPAHSAEDFLSPITKHVPLLNRSERAFVAPGNWMRQAVIDKLARNVTDDFTHPITDHDLQLIVDTVNDATLRGNTKWLGKTNGQLVGSLLFSTKGLVSGPQFIGDGLRAVLDRSYSPAARRVVAKQVASYIGTGTAMLGLAAMGGYGLDKAGKPVFVKVHLNPYDTNFGQIEVGGMRWNYWGNDATLVRTVIQVARGREQRPAYPTLEASRRRLTVNYLGNKVAPGLPAFAFNEIGRGGRDITGQSINTPKGFGRFAWDQVDPILASNIVEAYHNLGVGGAAATAPAELFGGTTSTFQPSESDIRAGTKARVEQKLDAAGITTLEDQGWKSDYWKRALEPVGGPTQGFGSFDDYRANYINTWTQYGVQQGKSYGESLAAATKQFDSQGAVQQWHKDLASARLQKWREHPELLKEARDAGVETLSKAEAKILDDYIQSLQQQPAGVP